MVASTIRSLDKRFDELLNDDTVLVAAIFDPLNWPAETEQTWYGNNLVATPANRFKNHVTVSQNPDGISSTVVSIAVAEWQDLFLVLQGKKVASYRDVYDAVVSARRRFPVIADLLQLAATLPLSTAECQGFSTMNLVKTKLQNRLDTATLDDLLLVKCNKPSMADYNCVPAIHSWAEFGSGPRHVRGHALGSGRKAYITKS